MGIGKMALFYAMVVLLALSVNFQGKCVSEAKVHHVVGDDRGWDPSSDVTAWAARKIFRIGDSLWFTYSVALENIVELRSREEYESCDVSNPIKMYTDGLSEVSLDREGMRYFVSGNLKSCKNGLRLPVEVKPRSGDTSKVIEMKPLPQSEKAALASTPVSPPSRSTRIASKGAVAGRLLSGVLLVYFVAI